MVYMQRRQACRMEGGIIPRTKKEKVYIVVCEYSLNDSMGLDLTAFNSLDKAKAFLEKDYKEICREYSYDTAEFDETEAALYEEGYYASKHCTWEIKECIIK